MEKLVLVQDDYILNDNFISPLSHATKLNTLVNEAVKKVNHDGHYVKANVSIVNVIVTSQVINTILEIQIEPAYDGFSSSSFIKASRSLCKDVIEKLDKYIGED